MHKRVPTHAVTALAVVGGEPYPRIVPAGRRTPLSDAPEPFTFEARVVARQPRLARLLAPEPLRALRRAR